MSWLTVIWSVASGACLMTALMHLTVWGRNRRSWANLCFSVTALAAIGLSIGEMFCMRTDSIAVFGRTIQWVHLIYAIGVAGSLGFVHFYFGTGAIWLLVLAISLRLLAVLVNFTTGANLHIKTIQSLQKINFFGEHVSVLGVWTPNKWAIVGQAASLVQFVYVADATIRLARCPTAELRKRALIVGGALVFFIVFAAGQANLVATGLLRMPFIISLPFIGLVMAMGYELSNDSLRAAQLGRELQESEGRLALAADAVNLGLWSCNFEGSEIQANYQWRALYGFSDSEPLRFEMLLERIYPDDRDSVRQAWQTAVVGDGHYEMEYRIPLPDAQIRWIASRGQIQWDENRKPRYLRGVSMDVTERKHAEEEAMRQRTELTHLSRITLLGELSGSLAHELNQPLAAILSNAQAAQRFLAQDQFDLDEVRDILNDIVTQDHRAGEVIRRLRLLLRKGELQQAPLNINEVVSEVLKLTRNELANQGVMVKAKLASGLPTVLGDHVQLQQVLLNLVLNGCDAMENTAPADRRLTITSEFLTGDGVCVSVSDRGIGIATDRLEDVFQPFFTTKSHGLGLGLSVCRTIITAHRGKLWAVNNPAQGLTFHFTVPTA